MGRYNRTILMGRLVRDTELKDVGEHKLYKNCIAVNAWKKDDPAMFIDFTVWNKKAEVLAEYVGKGDEVLLEGELKLEKWDDKDGNKRSKHVLNVTEFSFVNAKGGGQTADDTGEVPF